MHILLTNDDGVTAPGLLALAQTLRQLGDLTIFAPDRNWSISGHSRTIDRPLRIHETTLADGTPAWKSDGSPSDCVALALLGFIQEPIDLVVSGINPNANIGHDITYSGTVTAALEAIISNIPGIAISLDSPNQHDGSLDYQPAAQIAALIAQQVLGHGLPKEVVLNINVPYGQFDSFRGVQITRQGLRIYRDALIRRKDPHGQPYYWIGGEEPTGIPKPGTDFWAIKEGYVSITPLHLNLTADDWIPKLKSWNLNLQP